MSTTDVTPAAPPNWIAKVLQDVDGNPSSKRVIVLGSMVFLSIYGIANIFYNVKVDPMVIDALKYTIITGIGAIGAEKFTNRPK